MLYKTSEMPQAPSHLIMFTTKVVFCYKEIQIRKAMCILLKIWSKREWITWPYHIALSHENKSLQGLLWIPSFRNICVHFRFACTLTFSPFINRVEFLQEEKSSSYVKTAKNKIEEKSQSAGDESNRKAITAGSLTEDQGWGFHSH